MEESIELKLIGITYNQIESGVYALVLEDMEDRRRLAIVIGYPEAQSIECHLRKVRTSRPLSHDLMASMLKNLGAELMRVDIHRLPSGPYAGKLTVLTPYGQIKEIDARSSDAVALAVRVGAPIFTSRQLLEKEGYLPKTGKQDPESQTSQISSDRKEDLTRRSTEELKEYLEKLVHEENYEEAAKIKRELDRRNMSD